MSVAVQGKWEQVTSHGTQSFLRTTGAVALPALQICHRSRSELQKP